MLVDWVLRAYEFDPTLDMPAKIVLGPFMGTSQQTGFMERVARLKHVEAITFEANMEALMQRALAVVAMGGYNTFCEILSFDKRALILPRTAPRAEQYHPRRARRPSSASSPCCCPTKPPIRARWSRRCARLPNRRRPSKVHIPGLLDGLSVINSLVDQYLGAAAPHGRAFRRASPSSAAAREQNRPQAVTASMSRLDFMISRLTAQRALLDGGGAAHRRRAGLRLRARPRQRPHLRPSAPALPGREIFAFDRAISAHPKCIPDGDHMILGEIRETLQFCGPRIPGKPAFIHVDLGSGDPTQDLITRAWLSPLVAEWAAPGHDRPRRPAARRRLPELPRPPGCPKSGHVLLRAE